MVVISYLWTLPQLYHIFFTVVTIRATYFNTVSCGSYLCCRRRYRAAQCISLGMYNPNKFCSCCKWSCVAFASHFARWKSNRRSLITVSDNTVDSCLFMSRFCPRCPPYYAISPPRHPLSSSQRHTRNVLTDHARSKRSGTSYVFLSLKSNQGSPNLVSTLLMNEFRFSRIRSKAKVWNHSSFHAGRMSKQTNSFVSVVWGLGS